MILLLLKRVVLFALFELVGIVALRYSNRLVLWVGQADLAERFIPGGTVGMWKLVGIICTIGGILLLFGYARSLGL